MHRFLLLFGLLAAVAIAGCAGAAGAAVPKRAQLVGGPTRSGATLRAWKAGRHLCTVIRGGAADALDDAEAKECDDSPPPLPLGHETIDAFLDGPQLVYGVAGSEVAAVELAAGDRPVTHAATVAGTGALAGWRFFVVEAPKGRATELHVLDAEGRVRRAEQLEDDFWTALFDPPPPGLRRLAGGRRGGTAWALEAYPKTRLAPTPLEPTRRVQDTCVHLRLAISFTPFDACAGPDDDQEPLVVMPAAGCGGLGVLVPLAVQPGVARVRATLGDGRRIDAVLRDVPGAASGVRAGVVLAPRGMAVRGVAAYDASGRRLTRVVVGSPPVATRCPPIGRILGVPDIFDLFDEDLGAGVAAPGGDAGRLDADDRGAALCLTPAGAPPSAAACRRPPVEVEDAWLTTRVVGDQRVVLGAVPVEIGRVRVQLDDATTMAIAPEPLPETYAGRYRDVVRIVHADVPSGRRVLAFELADAGGRAVLRWFGPDRGRPRHATTLLRDRRGHPALVAADEPRATWFRRADAPWPCLATGPLATTPCEHGFPDSVILEVRCHPRRTVISGFTRSADDRLTLTTASGRVIHGRTAALPHGLGRGGAALLVAPASAAPGRLTLHRHVPRRAVLDLPPAARQCGYASTVTIFPPNTLGLTGGFWMPRQPGTLSAATAASNAASLGSTARSRHGTALSIADG